LFRHVFFPCLSWTLQLCQFNWHNSSWNFVILCYQFRKIQFTQHFKRNPTESQVWNHKDSSRLFGILGIPKSRLCRLQLCRWCNKTTHAIKIIGLFVLCLLQIVGHLAEYLKMVLTRSTVQGHLSI
jgi:hypothetical protein